MLDEPDRKKWLQITAKLSQTFADGQALEMEDILFLVGLRELGQNRKKFKKDEKIDLLHIAICRLLMPYGYYQLEGHDEDGWPHYQLLEELPPLKSGEQQMLIKEAIIRYFEEEEIDI